MIFYFLFLKKVNNITIYIFKKTTKKSSLKM